MNNWGIAIVIIFIIAIVIINNKKKSHHKTFSYTRLNKYVGMYSFWRQYANNWTERNNYLDVLKMHNIHYLRFWVITPEYPADDLPWKMVGDHIYDLNQFNEEWFKNMHNFIQHAADNEIVLNIIVFDDCHIRHHIQNCPETRNVNGINNEHDWYFKPEAREFAKRFVDKMSQEFNGYQNVIFTLCNENFDYHDWIIDMTNYAYGKLKQLDTGGSAIPAAVLGKYAYISHHGIVNASQIHNGDPNRDIFNSDGWHPFDSLDQIEAVADRACQVGKGYEIYQGNLTTIDLVAALERLKNVSMKYNGF